MRLRSAKRAEETEMPALSQPTLDALSRKPVSVSIRSPHPPHSLLYCTQKHRPREKVHAGRLRHRRRFHPLACRLITGSHAASCFGSLLGRPAADAPPV